MHPMSWIPVSEVATVSQEHGFSFIAKTVKTCLTEFSTGIIKENKSYFLSSVH